MGARPTEDPFDRNNALLVIEGHYGPPPPLETLVGASLALAVILSCFWFGLLFFAGATLNSSFAPILRVGSWSALCLPPVAGLVGGCFVRRYYGARCGVVDFFPERVSFVKMGRRIDVSWNEVLGYSDSSPAFIQLLASRGIAWERWRLAIPTHTEEERVAVLNILSQKTRRLNE